MIPYTLKSFTSDDGHQIFYNTTPITQDIKQVMLIVHGMAEHAGSYRAFSEYLFRHDTGVYAINLRGHGPTGEAEGPLGHFADEDGWQRSINDIVSLREIIKKENPSLPVFILGHSMGSILVRCCLIDYGHLFTGGIICGTTVGGASGLISIGNAIAKREMDRYCPKHPSKVLNKLTFGLYNISRKIPRTDFDWIATNEAFVDSYIADPLCGFVCTSAFYRDMFGGLRYCNDTNNIAKMPKDLPILLIAGDQDPVGGKGKEVRQVYKKMQNAGLTNVQMTLFNGLRHSILSEKHAGDVYGVVNGFIERCHNAK